MALSAAASLPFSALAPLLALLFVFASAPSLPRAGASAFASTPPFSETCYNTIVVQRANSLLFSVSTLRTTLLLRRIKYENLLLILLVVSICMRGLDLILSKVDRRTS